MKRKLSALLGAATLSVGLTALAGAVGGGVASASIPRTGATCTVAITVPPTQVQASTATQGLPAAYVPVTAPAATWTPSSGCTGTPTVTVTNTPAGVTGTPNISGKSVAWSGTPTADGLKITTVTVTYSNGHMSAHFDWADEYVIYTDLQNAYGCTEAQWAGATCPTTGLTKGQTALIEGVGFPPGDLIESGECNADAGQEPPLGAVLGQIPAGALAGDWMALNSSPTAQCTAPATTAQLSEVPYLDSATLLNASGGGVWTIHFHIISGQLGSDASSNCPLDQAQAAAGVACILAAADVNTGQTFDALLSFGNPQPNTHVPVDATALNSTATGPCVTSDGAGGCLANITLTNQGSTPETSGDGTTAVGGFNTFGVYDNSGTVDTNCQAESTDTVTSSMDVYQTEAEAASNQGSSATGYVAGPVPLPWTGAGTPPAEGGIAWSAADIAAHPGASTGGNGDPGVCNATASDALFAIGWGPAVDGAVSAVSGGASPDLAPFNGCTTGAIAKTDFTQWLIEYASDPTTAEGEPYVGCIIGNGTVNGPDPSPLGNSATTHFGGFTLSLTLPFNKGGAAIDVYGGKFTLPHVRGTTFLPALGQQQLFVNAVVYPHGVNY